MSAPADKHAPSAIEAAVLRIRALMGKSQFRAALDIAEPLLAQVPQNRDVLYMIAVNQRYLGRISHALDTLGTLEVFHPAYARLFQERGHCLVAARDPAAAIQAYLAAVALNPALPASWKALHVLFRTLGHDADAALAASHAATLSSLPVAVVTGRSMLAEGEIHEAERVVRQFLQAHPDHIEGMRLLAQIGMKLDVLDDAEFLLESVLVFDPEYALARHDYCNVLIRRHRHAKALLEIDVLLKPNPADRTYRTLRATALVGSGDHAAALRLYRELALETPQEAELHLSIAHALKTLGKQREAIDSYRRAAGLRSDYGDAYWSLANLKTYRFTADENAAMRRAENAPDTQLVDRYHLCFALGKALEDDCRYADAFRYYERGNGLKRTELNFRIDAVERDTQLQKSVCTAPFFASRRGMGREAGAPGGRHQDNLGYPIFIVGLPRSGSTLLEQILASHSRVEGTMELADVPRLVQTLRGREQSPPRPRYPGALSELTAAQWRSLGQQYLDDTAIYRTGKPFFIDKMPNNFRHLGLIHLMLPQAKIIDARREPMACCFSNFKQLFATGQEFTYSLEDIARYYRTYVELMDHWNTVLPGKILRVDHESVVHDLDCNVRRLLDFCGLEFETACLEFHKNERSVRTASSEQVRRPLYKEGLDQWRHFEPWLEPLRRALGDSQSAQVAVGGTRH